MPCFGVVARRSRIRAGPGAVWTRRWRRASSPDVISRGGPDAQHCSVLRIPDGVTLASGRSATADGALLFLDHQIAQRFMLDLGSHTRVTGLRLRGDDVSDAKGVPGDLSSA